MKTFVKHITLCTLLVSASGSIVGMNSGIFPPKYANGTWTVADQVIKKSVCEHINIDETNEVILQCTVGGKTHLFIVNDINGLWWILEDDPTGYEYESSILDHETNPGAIAQAINNGLVGQATAPSSPKIKKLKPSNSTANPKPSTPNKHKQSTSNSKTAQSTPKPVTDKKKVNITPQAAQALMPLAYVMECIDTASKHPVLTLFGAAGVVTTCYLLIKWCTQRDGTATAEQEDEQI